MLHAIKTIKAELKKVQDKIKELQDCIPVNTFSNAIIKADIQALKLKRTELKKAAQVLYDYGRGKKQW